MKLIIVFLVTCITLSFAEVSYNQPESVVYDSIRSCYYISNKATGEILKRDSGGALTLLCQFDTSVRGLHILGDYLYSAGNNGVSKINISNASLAHTYTFTGMSFLNDVTSNDLDSIFVSDTGTGKIFGINTVTNALFTLVSGISAPNGLLYDKTSRRLQVCSWSGNWIKSIDFNNNLSISTLATTTFSSLDGLTVDKFGNIFVSSWSTNSVYMYRTFPSQPILVQSGFTSPADIFCNKEQHVLVVPNFDGNTIDYIDLTSVGISQDHKKKVNLLNNYPNPFNPTTTISYELDKANNIKLTVYNAKGELVKMLVNDMKSAGNYSEKFDASMFDSGVYFYKLEINGRCITKKMILLK